MVDRRADLFVVARRRSIQRAAWFSSNGPTIDKQCTTDRNMGGSTIDSSSETGRRLGATGITGPPGESPRYADWASRPWRTQWAPVQTGSTESDPPFIQAELGSSPFLLDRQAIPPGQQSLNGAPPRVEAVRNRAHSTRSGRVVNHPLEKSRSKSVFASRPTLTRKSVPTTCPQNLESTSLPHQLRDTRAFTSTWLMAGPGC
jgi:hypothetical protein